MCVYIICVYYIYDYIHTCTHIYVYYTHKFICIYFYIYVYETLWRECIPEHSQLRSKFLSMLHLRSLLKERLNFVECLAQGIWNISLTGDNGGQQ
jgi:hypothetical protein